MTTCNDTRAAKRDLFRFRYIVCLSVCILCLSAWMLQTAYEQNTHALRIGDQTGERLQMRGLIDQEGVQHD